MQPLNLAGGGRRIGSGEEMADAVVQTDAVEEDVQYAGRP
jgi:hypothetical protein